MKEKTKEFLEKVGGYGNQALLHSEDVEKYTELVVKECIAQLQEIQYESGDEWDHAIRSGVAKIESHFGV